MGPKLRSVDHTAIQFRVTEQQIELFGAFTPASLFALQRVLQPTSDNGYCFSGIPVQIDGNIREAMRVVMQMGIGWGNG